MGILNKVKASRLRFAVVDVETTGLDKAVDRVVEIAVVWVDGNGNVEHEWSTLINPRTGKSGPTRIHGIEDQWLAAAPSFDQVVGDLRDRLVGRILTAHNAGFDTDFIEAELRRAGIPTTGNVMMFDTIDVTSQLGIPNKLVDACAHLGVRYQPHAALDDARATAQMLGKLMKRVDLSSFAKSQAVAADWIAPHVPASGITMPRQMAAQLTTPRDLAHEISFALPPNAQPARDAAVFAPYRDHLSAAVADGYVDPGEVERLINVARALNMNASDVREAHYEVFLGRLDAALADGRFTKTERAKIETEALWLGVRTETLDEMVKASKKRVKLARAEFRELMAGATVGFAGRGGHPNNIRKALCAQHGIIFQSTVTSTTSMLILGMPDAAGANVTAAAQRQLPTISETEFWSRLGEG